MFIAGLFTNIRFDYHLVIYYFFTISLYIFWPYRQGIRFIFPILPIYVYFIIKGLEWSISYFKEVAYIRTIHAFKYLFFIFIIVSFIILSLILAKNNLINNRVIEGPFDSTSMGMFNFVSNHTDQDSVVVFFKPRVMRMLTNRNAIMINKCEDLHKGDYLVYYKKTYNQVFLASDTINCNKFINSLTLIYDNENFRVYKIIRKNNSGERLQCNPK